MYELVGRARGRLARRDAADGRGPSPRAAEVSGSRERGGASDPLAAARARIAHRGGSRGGRSGVRVVTPVVVDALDDAGLFGLMVPARARRARGRHRPRRSRCSRSCRAPTGRPAGRCSPNATTLGVRRRVLGDDAAVRDMFGDRATVRSTPACTRRSAPRTSRVDDGATGPGYRDLGPLPVRERLRVRDVDRRRHARAARRRARDEPGDGHARPPGVLRAQGPRARCAATGTSWASSRPGSFDYDVAEQFVADRATRSRCSRRSVHRGGPIYRLGVLGLTSAGHAGVRARRRAPCARRARASVVQHEATHGLRARPRPAAVPARLRVPRRRAAGRPRVRVRRLRRRRGDGPAGATTRRPLQLQRLRQATTYATRVAADAVRFAYLWAGSDALRSPSALQRCFRDIHAGTQHVFVDNNTLTATTQVLLGPSEHSAVTSRQSQLPVVCHSTASGRLRLNHGYATDPARRVPAAPRADPRPETVITFVRAAAAAGLDHVCTADHVSFFVGAGTDGLLERDGARDGRRHDPDLRGGLPAPAAPSHARRPPDRRPRAARAGPARSSGVGIGGEDPHEYAVCGVDPRTRGRRMDECLTGAALAAHRHAGHVPRRVLRPRRRARSSRRRASPCR